MEHYLETYSRRLLHMQWVSFPLADRMYIINDLKNGAAWPGHT